MNIAISTEEERKQKEAEFHDRRESLKTENPEEYSRITKNQRFYSINGISKAFMDNWLIKRAKRGDSFLDYCCGTGHNSLFIAQHGGRVTGIDISAESVQTAKKSLEQKGLNGEFVVGDAENTKFPDSTFDVILCNGVLHHLDVDKAYPELARILKPTGEIFCVEALSHNPIFQWYRQRTPQMRTEWEVEHILNRDRIQRAKKYFNKIDLNFFHLISLLAVPLRKYPILFNPLLAVLDGIDKAVLSVPLLRWWAWQCLFIMSKPKK